MKLNGAIGDMSRRLGGEIEGMRERLEAAEAERDALRGEVRDRGRLTDGPRATREESSLWRGENLGKFTDASVHRIRTRVCALCRDLAIQQCKCPRFLIRFSLSWQIEASRALVCSAQAKVAEAECRMADAEVRAADAQDAATRERERADAAADAVIFEAREASEARRRSEELEGEAAALSGREEELISAVREAEAVLSTERAKHTDACAMMKQELDAAVLDLEKGEAAR